MQGTKSDFLFCTLSNTMKWQILISGWLKLKIERARRLPSSHPSWWSLTSEFEDKNWQIPLYPLVGKCCNYQPKWKKRTASSHRAIIGTLFTGYLPGNHIFLSAKQHECSRGPHQRWKLHMAPSSICAILYLALCPVWFLAPTFSIL